MPSVEELFQAFWTRYPRKVGKLDACKAYGHALRMATAEDILAGLENYCAHLPEDVRFIAHPATWIRAGRWMDEYALPAALAPKVEGRKDCQHEPRCPSNDWHRILLQRAGVQAERAEGAA